MTTKLIQKSMLKGTYEFELGDEAVLIKHKTPLKEETLTVVLTILNPEPILNGNYLEFHSRVKKDALVTLRLNKPNRQEFEDFVSKLSKKAQSEYNAFLGVKTDT